MKRTLKTVVSATLWLTGGLILLATFAFAVLLWAYGETGAGIVILGLALLEAVVLLALWVRPTRQAKTPRGHLSATG